MYVLIFLHFRQQGLHTKSRYCLFIYLTSCFTPETVLMKQNDEEVLRVQAWN